MSFKNYFNENKEEEIIHGIKLERSDKSVKKEFLGFTKKRVYYFSQYKKQDRIYREVPLSKINYIEHGWHDKRRGMLIAGIICLVAGLIVVIYTFGILAAVGIFLIIKGKKQYGYLTINNWTLTFHSRDYLKPIERFISLIHYTNENLA